MPASSEFISLCQSQVALLTQGMGAALTIVYLTEELTNSGDTHLIPAIAYPEAALDWGEEQIVMFLTQVKANLRQRLLATRSLPSVVPGAVSGAVPGALPDVVPATVHPLPTDSPAPEAYPPTERLLPQQQIVRPLIY
ncbi:MAG: hypothetical protein ACKO7W_11720, partial [Elainella sp.]